MEELNRRMAETAHSSTLLVSRDTAWVIYRLAHSERPFNYIDCRFVRGIAEIVRE